MNIDWKDALNALKDSGAVPIDDNPHPKPAKEPAGIQKSPLRVLIDRKGRKGKTATIIENFEGCEEELEKLAKTLKQKLGTGGSCRDGEILIQGDRMADVKALLTEMGYKVK